MCRYICGASRPAGSISSTLIPSSSACSMMVLCIPLLCHDGQVPRTASPAVRAALVERAAEMLVRREPVRSEEHTSELQSRQYLVCRLLLEKKKHQCQALSWSPPPPCPPCS